MKKKSIIVIGFAILILIIMTLALTGIIEESIGMCVALTMTVIFNLLVAILAYKSDIKVVTVLMTIFMIVGVVLLGLNVYNILKKDVTDKDKFLIQIKEDTSPKMSIFSYNSYNYYTYNLSEVNITIKDENKYTLKDALQGGHITLDEILSMAIPNENTQGYKIYYDGGEDESLENRYSIVVCENSKDIIFTTYNYAYEESICRSN